MMIPVKGAMDVLNERFRQIAQEKFDEKHDSGYTDDSLAKAAVCYCKEELYDTYWPWHSMWWKPSSKRRNLVKAAALIIAEIDRLDYEESERETK